MGHDVKNTVSRPVSELQTTSPRSFLLKPMTALFLVLKNVLSGRFNARDDFWVVQVAKKPSQLVFVSSMAISQDDPMAVFGASGRRSFPTQNGPLSNVLGVMFLTLCSLL